MDYLAQSTNFAKIKVVGVGGGGCNAVRTMISDGVEGAEFVVMNTDMQALNDSPCENRVQLGERLTRGIGAAPVPTGRPGSTRA